MVTFSDKVGLYVRLLNSLFRCCCGLGRFEVCYGELLCFVRRTRILCFVDRDGYILSRDCCLALADSEHFYFNPLFVLSGKIRGIGNFEESEGRSGKFSVGWKNMFF